MLAEQIVGTELERYQRGVPRMTRGADVTGMLGSEDDMLRMMKAFTQGGDFDTAGGISKGLLGGNLI